jgi:hypothetical protein
VAGRLLIARDSEHLTIGGQTWVQYQEDFDAYFTASSNPSDAP